MKWSRPVSVVVLLAALGAGVSKTTSVSAVFPVSAPCNASAMAAPFRGPLKVQSVASFGCVESWGYLWATVGTGAHEVGVTEVVRYYGATRRWRSASRLKYCNHHLLPAYVEFWGCNSN
ncbi:MAG TPA: hypothetical protein VNF05_07145 [Acidimicrobiales bacterium]|nr:hypothetical protein [Acidimicrobiales bacterium]